MALKDETAPAGSSSDYATSAQQATSGAPNVPLIERGEKWGFFSSGLLGGISRQATSEVLTKAMNVMTETFKTKLSIDAPMAVTLLPVDNAKETKLYLSSIIVCLRNAEDKNLGVSYHVALLEGSNEPMTPRIENFNNSQIVIDRVAGDVMDTAYADVVHGIVTRAFPGMVCRANSAQVIPRTFNWEDADAVRNLAVNTIYPDVSDLEVHHPAFADIDLTKWSHDSTLQVQVNFNEPERLDYAGLPVRNNIAISLTAVDSTKQNNQTVNNQERSRKISHLGGFIDLIWAPEPNANNPYGVAAPGPQYKFSPRFIMTSLENVMRMTPASQLLAMVTSLTLREQNNWYPYYNPRPQAAGNRIDLRDIGAINIEANLLNEPSGYGTRIDTKTASFSHLDLGKLLSTTIRPGLTFSMDVSECGSDTWYNEIFLAAAAGSSAAQQAILEAANTLTGGIFARHYNSNESPVFVNEDRIHLGYYVGQDGLKHDVRDIDYLAVLNLLGESDPQAAQAWSDTFLRLEYPLIKRLAERKKMIVSMVNGDVVFTGFARRVTVMGRFMECLALACKEAGLDARVTSPSFGGDYLNQRAVAGFLPQTTVQPGVSGLFSSGFGMPAAQFAGRGYGGRWG